MATTKRNIGLEILEGLREIKRGEYGRVTTVPSISSIRDKTGLTQAKFSQLLGVSMRTLQEWEQGHRAPSGAARTLLLIAQKESARVARGRVIGLRCMECIRASMERYSVFSLSAAISVSPGYWGNLITQQSFAA